MKYEKQSSYSQKVGKVTFSIIQCMMKSLLMIFFVNSLCPSSATSSLVSWQSSSISSSGTSTYICSDLLSDIKPSSEFIHSRKQSFKLCPYLSWLQKQVLGKKQTSNFLAKYLHGNRVKGIINMHLNIRSLGKKVVEVKKLLKEHSPNILGLSECELKKVDNQFDERKLKIPGYEIIFPQSWTTVGYARVVVYV